MLDEVQVPKEPRLYTCPCCLLSTRDMTEFLAHLERMKRRIDAAAEAARRKR